MLCPGKWNISFVCMPCTDMFSRFYADPLSAVTTIRSTAIDLGGSVCFPSFYSADKYFTSFVV